MKLSARSALKVTLTYVLVGVLWILLSDRLVTEMVSTPEQQASWQLIKGWLYVAFTALLLYLMISTLSKQRTSAPRLNALSLLPDRQSFEKEASAYLSKAHRSANAVGLLLIDVDDFQSVNDISGYYGGDRLIASLARLLEAHAPAGSALYHFGGDKFVLLSYAASPADSERLARNISGLLTAELNVTDDEHHVLSVSIGIASFPDDAYELDDLLKFADAALQRAKQEKGGICHFHRDLYQRQLWLKTLSQELGVAAQGQIDQFNVLFQPQYELRTNCISGVEALIRWHHPNRGVVSPVDFIPVAENNGTIFPLTERVVHQSIELLTAYGLLGKGGIGRLSINISERLVGSEASCARMEAMLKPYAEYMPYLTFEITETAAMENVDACFEMMQRLCAQGARFSIDDFGTGFSSLLKLKQLPIHELKIDRSFIDELPNNKDDLAIVRTTILMARELGIEVVAEGIENAEQEQALRAQNCPKGQGYYFAKPMAIANLKTLVDDLRRA